MTKLKEELIRTTTSDQSFERIKRRRLQRKERKRLKREEKRMQRNQRELFLRMLHQRMQENRIRIRDRDPDNRIQ